LPIKLQEKQYFSIGDNRIGRGGDRVAVRLEGVKLEMTAAIVREADKDMLDRLPKQARSNYFLIEFGRDGRGTDRA
jgi:hypothetical protein